MELASFLIVLSFGRSAVLSPGQESKQLWVGQL